MVVPVRGCAEFRITYSRSIASVVVGVDREGVGVGECPKAAHRADATVVVGKVWRAIVTVPYALGCIANRFIICFRAGSGRDRSIDPRRKVNTGMEVARRQSEISDVSPGRDDLQGLCGVGGALPQAACGLRLLEPATGPWTD